MVAFVKAAEAGCVAGHMEDFERDVFAPQDFARAERPHIGQPSVHAGLFADGGHYLLQRRWRQSEPGKIAGVLPEENRQG